MSDRIPRNESGKAFEPAVGLASSPGPSATRDTMVPREAAPARRPKLLLLAYYFPPVNTIGAVRALNIAKWLTRIGWEVTVVTLHSSAWTRTDSPEAVDSMIRAEGIRCVRTPHAYSLLSSASLVTGGRRYPRVIEGAVRRTARFLRVEDELGWLAEVERACAGLTKEDIDLVMATGPPFGAFRLADRLARGLRVPFVLDYRDLWTGNPHASRRSSTGLNRAERKLLSRASAVTVVSPSLGRSLVQEFDVGKKIHVISNGYDGEDLVRVEPRDFGHFAIIYAGTFYPPKRVIAPFITVLQGLKERARVPTSSWRFHYYGPQPEHVQAATKDAHLEGNIEIHGLVPRGVVLSALRGAGLSVVVTSVNDSGSLQDNSIVTGKIFEAVGARTPSLAIAPPGSDLEEIFRVTGLGSRFTATQQDEMTAFLENAILNGVSPSSGGEAYEWSRIVLRLDAVLQTATRGRA